LREILNKEQNNQISYWTGLVSELDNDNYVWQPPEDFKRLLQEDKITPLQLLDVVTDCYFHLLGANDMSLQMIIQQVSKLGINTDAPSKSELEKLIVELDTVAASFSDQKRMRSSKNHLARFIMLCSAEMDE